MSKQPKLRTRQHYEHKTSEERWKIDLVSGIIFGIATIFFSIVAIFVTIFFSEIKCLLKPDLDECMDYRTVNLVTQTELPQIESYNLGLTNGEHHFPGIKAPFFVGWKVTTQCSDRGELAEEIAIPLDIDSPIEAYFLIQSGWGITRFYGKTIGNILFRFEGKSDFVAPLDLGINIRDWAENDPIAVTTENSDSLVEIHKGVDENGKQGHIDLLTIPLPNSYKDGKLKEIIIQDTSRTNYDSLNPCIHLLGVTIKYRKNP